MFFSDRFEPSHLARASLPPSADLLGQLIASGLLARDWDPDAHPRAGAPPKPGWRDTGGYEVAENDKEPPPSEEGSEARGGGAGDQGQPRSVQA
jgi:hypothetical protein